MRYLQAVVFLAVLLAIGMFAVQNRNVITVSFLSWSLSQPVALLSVVVYVLGMLSGWALLAFMRRSFRGATERPRH
jgi:lipopolysaccharide assembly protein A